MKHLKLFESFEDIDAICRNFNIRNYTINFDDTIDVRGTVQLSHNRLAKLPLKFGIVSGSFFCNSGALTSLEGAPKEVGGNFYCNSNELTSLEGGPSEVKGDFICFGNKKFTSLKGSPNKVGGNFDCSYSNLTKLECSTIEVGAEFHCGGNVLTTLVGSPQKVYGGFNCCSNNLINLAGFPEFFEGSVVYFGNPVSEILDLFESDDVPRAIAYINEWDVIQDNTVILQRLEEVMNTLQMAIPQRIEFENYKIV
jgi:hypothetical protein